jgi:hypothetical protein
MDTNIRSALSILAELREGQVVTEMSGAIHDALAAVHEHGKDAVVIVRIKIKPFTKQNLAEPAITMTVEVEKKLPKEVPPSTLFFIGEDGNPQRSPVRQREMPFSVAPINNAQGD